MVNWCEIFSFKFTLRANHIEPFCLRLHAQALTLAALAGAAVVEYYDHKSEERAANNSRQQMKRN